MSQAKHFDLALQHMEQLLRDETPPEPRWEEIERELLARAEELERSSSASLRAGAQRSVQAWRLRADKPGCAPHSSGRTAAWLRAAGIAAMAAGIALAAGAGARSGSPLAAADPPRRAVSLAAVPLAAGQAGERGELDLHALRPGDTIEGAQAGAQGGAAPGEGVAVSDPGVIRWALAPGGRALVREVSARGAPARHIVALERGSLRAEVAPRDPSEGLVEAFTVEVGRTRVAVHGTLFTVTRHEDQVEVEVHRGIVAVGPAGDAGATTAHILIAPSRGAFSLDGARVGRLLAPRPTDALARADSASPATAPAPVALEPAAPPPEPAETALPARSSQGALAASHAAAPAPPAPAAPEGPVATRERGDATAPAAGEAQGAPPQLTPASVQASLASCFASRRPAGLPSVQTSIASTMRVSVRGDGSVAGVRFDPPLKPDLQVCAQFLYAGRFAAPSSGGPREVAIPIRIDE